MNNKNHNEYIDCFEDIETLTTINIPNQPNAISGNDLKMKIKNSFKIQNKKTIKDAISSINLGENDIILITGSLYLAGEVLKIN